MTDTNLATDPDGQVKIHPSEALLRVIIALLTPAFLTACGGDTQIARLAAFETIKQYKPRGHGELIVVAQIIACGLAAAASGVMSLRAEFSASMALRLRANAAALSRVAERAGRTLAETPGPNTPDLRFPEPLSPEQLEHETKVLADVADAHARTREAMARLKVAQPKAAAAQAPRPAATPRPNATTVPAANPVPVATTRPADTTRPAANTASAPAAAPTPAQAPEDVPVLSPFNFLTNEQWDAVWAGSMTDVADELTADLENLPPAEREEAIRKATILSNVANTLLSKGAPPCLRPGDANPMA